MKKLLVLLMLMGCMSSTTLKENGNTRTVNIKDFNAIRCEYCADIQFKQGKKYAVTASGSDESMKVLDIYKDGTTLVIARKELKKKKKSDKDKVYLQITAPEINKLDISGVADFHTEKMKVGDFEVEVKGVFDFKCKELTCKDFSYYIKGVSKAKAQIKAQTASIYCKGVDTSEFQMDSPKLQLHWKGVCNMDLDFKGKEVSIWNNGVGTIRAKLDCTSLKAQNKGVGKLYLSGTADQTEINSDGVNNVDASELNQF